MPATPQLKHTWATTIKDEFGSATLADTQTILGTNKFVENVLVPAGLTAEIDCGSLDKLKIVSMFIVGTQALSIATNDSVGSTGQNIALAANKAYAWNQNMPTSCPITVDITKIFAHNSGLTDATFKADFLLNLLI